MAIEIIEHMICPHCGGNRWSIRKYKLKNSFRFIFLCPKKGSENQEKYIKLQEEKGIKRFQSVEYKEKLKTLHKTLEHREKRKKWDKTYCLKPEKKQKIRKRTQTLKNKKCKNLDNSYVLTRLRTSLAILTKKNRSEIPKVFPKEVLKATKNLIILKRLKKNEKN